MTQISNHRLLIDKHTIVDFDIGELTDRWQPHSFEVEPVYSPDAIIESTPFSEQIFQLLCIAAKRLAGSKFKSANVSWSSTERGTDYRLDLVVRVDAEWEQIEDWEYAIQDEVTKLSNKWTASQWDDYSQHIFHSLVPFHL